MDTSYSFTPYFHAVHLYDILSQLDFYHNEKATVNITMTFLYFYLDVFYKEYYVKWLFCLKFLEQFVLICIIYFINWFLNVPGVNVRRQNVLCPLFLQNSIKNYYNFDHLLENNTPQIQYFVNYISILELHFLSCRATNLRIIHKCTTSK